MGAGGCGTALGAGSVFGSATVERCTAGVGSISGMWVGATAGLDATCCFNSHRSRRTAAICLADSSSAAFSAARSLL